MKENSFDVIVVGGGIVGLSFALGLAKYTTLSVGILETEVGTINWDNKQYHPRVSAITLASKRFFSNLNVWEEFETNRVNHFTSIHVWDERSNDLTFTCNDIAQSELGYIIENNLMQLVLQKQLSSYPQIKYFASTKLKSLQESENQILLFKENDEIFKTKLLIAADGSKSWVRSQINISTKRHEYNEKAIVATVMHELMHDNIARQIFLKSGPLAFLPLKNQHQSSIVWTLPKEQADEYQAIDKNIFMQLLAQSFEHRLGTITAIEKRYTFPLFKQKTDRYVLPRIALIGDAAHTIHPLAGLGVNLGLLDAACLIDVILSAIKSNRDYASLATLRRYERSRFADNDAIILGLDVIKNLFSSEKKVLQAALSFGLNLTNRSRVLRNFFTRYAVGNRENLPRLMMY